MARKTKKQNRKIRKSRKNKKRNIFGGANSVHEFKSYMESIKSIDCRDNEDNFINRHIENIKMHIKNMEEEYPDSTNILSLHVLPGLLNNIFCIKQSEYIEFVNEIIDLIPMGQINISIIINTSIGNLSKGDINREIKKQIFEKILSKSIIPKSSLLKVYKQAISNLNADIIWTLYLNEYKLNNDEITELQNFNERNNTEYRREQYDEIERILNIMKNDPNFNVSIISYAAKERGYHLDPETMQTLMEYSYY